MTCNFICHIYLVIDRTYGVFLVLQVQGMLRNYLDFDSRTSIHQVKNPQYFYEQNASVHKIIRRERCNFFALSF